MRRRPYLGAADRGGRGQALRDAGRRLAARQYAGARPMMRTFLASIAFLLAASAAPAFAQQEPMGVHVGVATCSGSGCHGSTERPRNSAVPGNEYLIWSEKDKHRNAYNVLLEDRAIKMARALGLPDAASQKACLDC